jgi:hypothetical protein
MGNCQGLTAVEVLKQICIFRRSLKKNNQSGSRVYLGISASDNFRNLERNNGSLN